MYNLLVGFGDGVALGSRVLEHTDDAILDYVAPKVGPAVPGRGPERHVLTERLLNLPTLVMPETGESGTPQFARVGHIESMKRSRADYTYRFVPSSTIPAFDTAQVVAAATALGITDWEFTRTHWAVKDVDLHRVLQEHLLAAVPSPRVFRLPIEQ